MKKGKNSFLSLIILLLLLQVITAVDTEINIKTLPDHEVQATIYDPESSAFSVLEGGKFKGLSDQYGDFNFLFFSDVLQFNLIIYIKKDGESRMDAEKILNHPAGETLDLRLAPDWFDFIETPVNETNVSEENLTSDELIGGASSETEELTEEDEINSGSGVTGFAIFGEGGLFSKKIFYYILALFALLVIMFATAKLTKFKLTKKPKDKDIKIKKLSELKTGKKEEKEEKEEKKEEKKEKKQEKIQDYKEIIEDAENKIKEAQEEIKKVKDRGNEEEIKKKKQEKIDDIKKKIFQYEKNLIKLRRDED